MYIISIIIIYFCHAKICILWLNLKLSVILEITNRHQDKCNKICNLDSKYLCDMKKHVVVSLCFLVVDRQFKDVPCGFYIMW